MRADWDRLKQKSDMPPFATFCEEQGIDFEKNYFRWFDEPGLILEDDPARAIGRLFWDSRFPGQLVFPIGRVHWQRIASDIGQFISANHGLTEAKVAKVFDVHVSTYRRWWKHRTMHIEDAFSFFGGEFGRHTEPRWESVTSVLFGTSREGYGDALEAILGEGAVEHFPSGWEQLKANHEMWYLRHAITTSQARMDEFEASKKERRNSMLTIKD